MRGFIAFIRRAITAYNELKANGERVQTVTVIKSHKTFVSG